MAVPYTFANATVSIPLSELDSNFATTITLGNTAIELGNTVTTLNNMTLANVTVSSGNVTVTNVSATTANVTNLTSSNVTITGGTIANVTISGSGSNITATNINASNVTVSTDLTLSGGTANGVAYLNGSKVLTTGSALTFDGTNLGVGTSNPAGFGSVLAVRNDTGFTASFNSIGTYGAKIRLQNIGVDSFDIGMPANTGSLNFSNGSGELMRLTSTGLGIGTSSPSAKLHVKGGNNNSLYIDNDGSRYTSTYILNNGTTKGALYWDNTNAELHFGTGVAAPIHFNINGGSAAILDASGNLGLGVTPSAWSGVKAVQINNASLYGYSNYEAGVQANAYFNGSAWTYIASAPATQYQLTNGVHKFFTAPSGTAGNAITFTQAMTLDASGNLGVGTSSPSTRLNVVSSGSGVDSARFSDGVNSTLLIRHGTGNLAYLDAYSVLGLFTGGSERMRIDSSGNLLVGTTTATHSGITSKCILKSSDNVLGVVTDSGNTQAVRFTNGTTAVGSINLTTSATSYSTSSDYRLKENIQPMQNALDVMAQLNPVTYTWKADGSDGQGFIAHELQAVVPDCVTGEKDAVDAEGNPVYQGIDTSFLVATLTKALQEAHGLIKDLESRIAALEAK